MSKILIIDDSRLITQFGKSILTGKGLEVLTAESGEMGLELAVQEQPDLILLDVILPGMDGYQICEQLKKTDESKDIPVIMLTSKAEPADKIKGLVLGAVDYVTKPFDAGELIARVKTHLRIKELYEALQERNRQLQEMANRDGLTNLYNHRFFHEHLSREMDRVRRYGGTITCVITDIDFFKKVNDTYGHQIGDSILKEVALILQKGIRESDLAARYGGEEFALVLVQTESQAAHWSVNGSGPRSPPGLLQSLIPPCILRPVSELPLSLRPGLKKRKIWLKLPIWPCIRPRKAGETG